MSLTKIRGIRKSEQHWFYELEKNQEFFHEFRRLLDELGFGDESSNIEISSFGRPTGDDGEPVMTKEENIKKYIDKYSYFENENYRIDIIFGRDKVFMIINGNKKIQEKISKKIQGCCSF